MHEIPELWGINLTQWLMLLTIVVWSLYDVFAYVYYGRQYTISVQIVLAGKKHYEIAFISGLIIGHWFLNIHLD